MPVNKWDPPVFMQVEESVHYSIDDLEAGDEWIYSSPFGAGSYREGPGNLTFAVDVFHHLHCLRYIRAALVKQDIGHDPIVHINHCLSYMREAVLCTADTTLEPGDFTTRNFTEQRTGATHECRDWRQLYKQIEDNWNNWYHFIKTSGLLTTLLGQWLHWHSRRISTECTSLTAWSGMKMLQTNSWK